MSEIKVEVGYVWKSGIDGELKTVVAIDGEMVVSKRHDGSIVKDGISWFTPGPERMTLVSPDAPTPAKHPERRAGQRWRSVTTIGKTRTLVVEGTLAAHSTTDSLWYLTDAIRDGEPNDDSAFWDCNWEGKNCTMALLSGAPAEPAKVLPDGMVKCSACGAAEVAALCNGKCLECFDSKRSPACRDARLPPLSAQEEVDKRTTPQCESHCRAGLRCKICTTEVAKPAAPAKVALQPCLACNGEVYRAGPNFHCQNCGMSWPMTEAVPAKAREAKVMCIDNTGKPCPAAPLLRHFRGKQVLMCDFHWMGRERDVFQEMTMDGQKLGTPCAAPAGLIDRRMAGDSWWPEFAEDVR